MNQVTIQECTHIIRGRAEAFSKLLMEAPDLIDDCKPANRF